MEGEYRQNAGHERPQRNAEAKPHGSNAHLTACSVNFNRK
jgi:hypothetical protein